MNHYKDRLKQTPTSYAEGFLAGYLHKYVGYPVPMPPGHSPAWTHGFTYGYGKTKNRGDLWIAGYRAFLNGKNLTGSNGQEYRDGFNAAHDSKDPFPAEGFWPAEGIPVNYPD